MPTFIRHITIDCAPPYEPYQVAWFWSQVLALPIEEDDEPDEDESCVLTPEGHPDLLFVRVPEGKTVKNRIHFDLGPELARDEEVERLTALGAKILDDRRKANGRGWVIMADPAGNEFCIEGNPAEYAAAKEAYEAEQARRRAAEPS
ncbi:VOC family protein [Streptomyces apocyni]|uniref:VOC family protein n=1 Tax=Streptomyces apocyni TaxID=2654677 RepID=UPI0018D1A8FF|nr:VOC family protein [Streptomyces apocyni]